MKVIVYQFHIMVFKTTSFLFVYLLLPINGKLQNIQNLETIITEFHQTVIKIDDVYKLIEEVIPGIDDDELSVRLQMFDASTKFPNGILNGNFIDLGNFDQCYNIKFRDYFGKYCLGTLPLTDIQPTYHQLLNLNKTNQYKLKLQLNPEEGEGNEYMNGDAMHFAVCVPSTVRAADIPGLTYTEDLCYSQATKPELTTGAIVMIVVFAIFAAIILISSIYDIILYYTEQKPQHELFIAFSFLTNSRKILSTNQNPDQLLCLNGIRAISMMWVILGHEISHITVAPLSNLLKIQEWLNASGNMFAIGAPVSVDTFFTIGGLVVVYSFMKSKEKGIKFNIALFYLHRYLRLTPIYVMIGLFNMYLIIYISQGPLWFLVNVRGVDPCMKGWWSSFLYITNYVQKGVCLPQTWYLSNDMQLFFLSPIILLLFNRSTKLALWVLGVLSIAGCAVPFAVGYSEKMTTTSSPEYSNLYYNQTHTRFGPYVIGMILGYFIYKLKAGKFKVIFKPIVVVILWLIILTGLVANVWAGYPLKVSTIEDVWGFSLFMAFNRPTWSVCVSGVIFLCVAGYGGFINWFLSLRIFQFLTKLSYSMYLVHVTVMLIRYSSMKTTFAFSNLQMMHDYWGDFMFTLVIAFVLSLAFESPVIIIEKYLFGSNKPKKYVQK